MRLLTRLCGGLRVVACALLALGLTFGSASAQTGYDRFGGDYAHFEVRTGDPDVCAARCERDARCRAWSFSYPRTAAGAATCWLKNQVPARAENTCCVSGVRGAGVVEPRQGATEYSIDRQGGDYRFVDLPPDGTADSCKAICDGEKRCRAFTFVRAGYISAAPRCYLKDRITRPRHKPCCISGVVR